MGQFLSQEEQVVTTSNYKVQKDDKNLRRQRAFFFPLGENRRLKNIDYLLIASDSLSQSFSIINQKETQLKTKNLAATSAANIQLMQEAIRESDHNIQKSKVILMEMAMKKDSFDQYLDDLFSNPATNGFVLYFTGQLTSNQELVMADKQGKTFLYHISKIIKRWRQVPNFMSKHLLLIIDAENSGFNLKLARTPDYNDAQKENLYGFIDQNFSQAELVHRRDPTLSIIASTTKQESKESLDSPSSKQDGDYKTNNRLDKNAQDFSNASDASKILSSLDNEQVSKFQKASNFTALFTQYLKNGPSSNLKNVALAKNVETKFCNDPYFLGYEVKTYLDFGIFFWSKYQQMINQMELNCIVAQGLTIQNQAQQNSNNVKIGKYSEQALQQMSDDAKLMHAKDTSELEKVNGLLGSPQKSKVSLVDINMNELDSKFLQKSAKGEFYGFVGLNKSKDKTFGNPLFSKPALANKSSSNLSDIKSMNHLDVSHIAASTQMGSLNNLEVSSYNSTNNIYKSMIILKGQQNLDDSSLVRKLFGMQEYIDLQKDKESFSQLYEGMWKDDKFHSFGTYYYDDGARYEGEYESGKKKGYGIYYYNSGYIYAGKFVDNDITGVGQLISPTGDIYVGNFVKNCKKGKGISKQTVDGTQLISQGEWQQDAQDGEFKIYIAEVPNVEMKAKFINGEIQGLVKYKVNKEDSEDASRNGNKNGNGQEIVFSAIWMQNRRQKDIALAENEHLSQAEKEEANSKYISFAENFDKLYKKFIRPTVFLSTPSKQ